MILLKGVCVGVCVCACIMGGGGLNLIVGSECGTTHDDSPELVMNIKGGIRSFFRSFVKRNYNLF